MLHNIISFSSLAPKSVIYISSSLNLHARPNNYLISARPSFHFISARPSFLLDLHARPNNYFISAIEFQSKAKTSTNL